MNKVSPAGAFDQTDSDGSTSFTHSAGKAHRNPMLLFVFVGALFQFDAQRPEFVLLFQLPPEYSPRKVGLFLSQHIHFNHDLHKETRSCPKAAPANTVDSSKSEYVRRTNKSSIAGAKGCSASIFPSALHAAPSPAFF